MPQATFPAAAMREQRRRADEYRRRAVALEARCRAYEAALRALGRDPAALVKPETESPAALAA